MDFIKQLYFSFHLLFIMNYIIKPLNFKDYILDVSDSEAVITFADWHYGMTTNNIWNKYNTDICRQRVSEFVSKKVDEEV